LKSVSFADKMWILTSARKLFSSTNGVLWAEEATSPALTSTMAYSDFLVFGGKVWLISPLFVWSSEDGVSWTSEPQPNWPARNWGFAALIFDGKIWLFGGKASDAETNLNDVWSSNDGKVWNQVAEKTEWAPRYIHAAFALDNKMWIIGGRTDEFAMNDVWCSTDGVQWQEPAPTAPFQGASGGPSEWTAYNRGVIAWHNQLLLMGYDKGTWSSPDGRSWTKIGDYGYGGDFIFNGKICGNGWYTSDCVTWREYYSSAGDTLFQGNIWRAGGKRDTSPGFWEVASSVSSYNLDTQEAISFPDAPWPGRTLPSSVEFMDRLWVMGGNANPYYPGVPGNPQGPFTLSDIWWTPDGTNWTQAPSPWTAGRCEFATTVMDNRMWVLGGVGAYGNDVWCTSDGETWTQVTPHAPWCARSGLYVTVWDNKLWMTGGVATRNDCIPLNDLWYSELGADEQTFTVQPPAGGYWRQSGQPLELRATGSGIGDPSTAKAGGTLEYQWFKDNVALPDATDSVYSVSTTGEADTGAYTCRIEDHFGGINFTNPALITIFPAGSLPAAGPVALCLLAAILIIVARRFQRRGSLL
jgi:hypothetical protein